MHAAWWLVCPGAGVVQWPEGALRRLRQAMFVHSATGERFGQLLDRQ